MAAWSCAFGQTRGNLENGKPIDKPINTKAYKTYYDAKTRRARPQPAEDHGRNIEIFDLGIFFQNFEFPKSNST